MVASLPSPQKSPSAKFIGSKYLTMGFNSTASSSRSDLPEASDEDADLVVAGAKAAAEEIKVTRIANFMVKM